MPLDPNILLRGSQMQSANNQNLLNTVYGALTRKQEDERYKERMGMQKEMFDLKRQQLKDQMNNKGMDFGRLAQVGMFKMASGQEPNPQEMAAVKMVDAQNQTKPSFDPASGRVVPRTSLFDALNYNIPSNVPQPDIAPSPIPQSSSESSDSSISVDLGAIPSNVSPKTKQKVEEQLAGAEVKQQLNDFSDAELQAAGFYDRMKASEEILGSLGNKALPDEKTALAGTVPLAGKYLERKAMTPSQEKFKSAAMNWIRANLRKESGAAIGKDEMADEFVNYFPQVGDDPEVVKQKSALRQIAMDNMKRSTGKAISTLKEAAEDEVVLGIEDYKSKYGLR